MERFSCAVAAEVRGESVVGTASRVDRWLLVEAPGAWAARALPTSRGLDDTVLLTLQRRAAALHARTLLVRRFGDAGAEVSARRVFVADSRPGRERLLTRTVAGDDLAGLELPYDGDAPGWTPVAALVGVCTHGSHDVCCAVRGRPVAAALVASHPDLTWEISHLGGDRFAANALVLPGGHYLGRLTADGAPAAVTALLAGERPDPCYRGRSCWATPVQAALALAGEKLGEARLDALRPTALTADGERRWRVALARTRGGHLDTVVVQTTGPDRSLLTCGAAAENPVPGWHLESLTPA